jgi:hypothetical protein
MITITQQNAIGFPGLFQNNPEDPTVQTTLPTVYEFGDMFSIELLFGYTPEDEEDTITGVTIDSVTLSNTGVPGVTVAKLNDQTIRFTGIANDVFTDSYYRFLMPDNTLKILPQDTTEPFLALVEYKPPLLKRKTYTYTLACEITYIGATAPAPTQINTTIAVTQDVVWNYNIAVAQFRAVLAKGVI